MEAGDPGVPGHRRPPSHRDAAAAQVPPHRRVRPVQLRRRRTRPSPGRCSTTSGDRSSPTPRSRRPAGRSSWWPTACPPTVAPGDALALDVHVVSDRRTDLTGRIDAELTWDGGGHRWAFEGDVAGRLVRPGRHRPVRGPRRHRRTGRSTSPASSATTRSPTSTVRRSVSRRHSGRAGAREFRSHEMGGYRSVHADDGAVRACGEGRRTRPQGPPAGAVADRVLPLGRRQEVGHGRHRHHADGLRASPT